MRSLSQDTVCTALTVTRQGYLFSRVVYTNSALSFLSRDAAILTEECRSGLGCSVHSRVTRKILELSKKIK